MNRILPLVVLTFATSPAYSGGLVSIPAPVPVVANSVVPGTGTNWTSNYAGVILGYGRLNRNDDNHNGFAGAFTLGHMKDFGSWVGAVELMAAPGLNAEVAEREVKWGVAARVKGGFKFGPASRWLGFATLGVGRGKSENINTGHTRNTNGYLYGVGVNYLLNDKVMVGSELIHVEKNGDGDAAGTGIAASLAYRF